MSTIEYESWAVDLADVAAVYPFQGSEVVMVVVGVVFWLAWHRIQYKMECKQLEEARKSFKHEVVSKSVERY